jgi:hypothetical protein
MSLAARFNQDLCKELHSQLGKCDWYQWLCEGPISNRTRERVDVVGKPKNSAADRQPTILIEAELKREDPASNVLKVWQCILQGCFPNGVIFVQGFSKVYRSPMYSNRRVKCKAARRLGRFVQDNSPGKFEYISLNIPYFPRAGRTEGDGTRRDWARWFGRKIANQIKRRRTA